MSRATVTRMFSSRDRAAISDQVVGVPSGHKITVGGFVFDLIPLTTSQATQILTLLQAIPDLTGKGPEAGKAVDVMQLLAMIAREGDRARELARSILYKTAKANKLIDFQDEGEASFDDWFDDLDIIDTLKRLLPAVLQASHLEGILGNVNAPPAVTAATAQLDLETAKTST